MQNLRVLSSISGQRLFCLVFACFSSACVSYIWALWHHCTAAKQVGLAGRCVFITLSDLV